VDAAKDGDDLVPVRVSGHATLAVVVRPLQLEKCSATVFNEEFTQMNFFVWISGQKYCPFGTLSLFLQKNTFQYELPIICRVQ
jgi:hypothetical protein